MRRAVLAALFLLVCPIAFAQMLCHAVSGPGALSPCEKKLAAAVPQEAFQKVYWPDLMKEKTSGLPFFRQGLTQYYGLDYEEAMRNFKEAKKDPRLSAMASWGIALAAGPNINLNMTDACHCLAKKEIKRAACLAGVDTTIALCPADSGSQEICEPVPSVTQLEKDLIKALKQRYDYTLPEESKKHAEDYRNAMAVISANHPDDKNVSTLYAESMMNLNPWDLYDQAGLPKRDETKTIVAVLKRSTGDTEEAIGANHYYIHAVEGSNPYIGSIHPADALTSANLLQRQVPESGHLVHMSSHIYLLVGDYLTSLKANINGSNNDVTQYGDACKGTYLMYTGNDKCPQLYYGHYLSHNYFFGSVSATFMGQSKNAMALACDTQAHVQRFVAYEPGLQRYLSAPLMTMVVNRNWDAICAETNCMGPDPSSEKFSKPKFEDCYSQGKEDSGCHVLRAIWYWARGMAHVAYSKDSGGNLSAMSKEIEEIPPCTENSRTSLNTFGNNCAKDVLKIGQKILSARNRWSDVALNGAERILGDLTDAVKQEDLLLYDEPPQWFTPAREALGGFYLQLAKGSDGSQYKTDYYSKARDVFDEALLRHPASGRALYGKMRALQGLDSKDAPAAVAAFHTAWLPADYTMTDDDLWPDMTISKPSKEVLLPSDCACQATRWPPLPTAKDVPAGDLINGVRVDYRLLNCAKKTTMSAGEPSVTATRPVP